MSEEQVEMVITGDISDLDSKLDQIAGQLEEIGKKGAESAKKTGSEWKSAMIAWNQGLSLVSKVMGIISKTSKFIADRGKEITQLNVLKMHSQWQMIRKDFEGIAEATGGAVTQLQLLKGVNTALAFRMDLTGGKLREMVEIARTSAAQMGMSFEESFNRLISGVGKREINILEELGVTFKDQTEAIEYYAASIGKTSKMLTTFEKKQAFANAVMMQLKENLETVSLTDALSNIDKVRFKTIQATTDLKVRLGEISEEGAKFITKYFDYQETEKRFMHFIKTNKKIVEMSKKQADEIAEYRKTASRHAVDFQRQIHWKELKEAARIEFDKEEQVFRQKMEYATFNRKAIVAEKQTLAEKYNYMRLSELQLHRMAKENIKEREAVFSQSIAKSFIIMANAAAGNFTAAKKGVDDLKKGVNDFADAEKKRNSSMAKFSDFQNRLNVAGKVAEVRKLGNQLKTLNLRKSELEIAKKLYEQRLASVKLSDTGWQAAIKQYKVSQAQDKEREKAWEKASKSWTFEAMADGLREAGEKMFNHADKAYQKIDAANLKRNEKIDKAREKELIKEKKSIDASAKANGDAKSRQAQQYLQYADTALSVITLLAHGEAEAAAKAAIMSAASAVWSSGQQMIAQGTAALGQAAIYAANPITAGIAATMSAAAWGNISQGVAMMSAGGAGTLGASFIDVPSGSGSSGSSSGAAASERLEQQDRNRDLTIKMQVSLFGSETEGVYKIGKLMGGKLR